jgi:BirA family biotin operon repressor/biotin-[acetyl-CoA-carboxylase] ligase
VLNSLINETKIAALVEVIAEVDSTQKVLLERSAIDLNRGVTLITHHQSAGIGRLDRTWQSEPGDSILMSFVFRSDAAVLPLFVGQGVAKAISKHLPNIKLKWPNDLVVEVGGQMRKLGGIVMQRHPQDFEIVVAGIGINMKFTASRPTDEAIALNELISQLPDVNQLIFEIITQLTKDQTQDDSEVVETYKKLCLTIGKNVIVQMLNSSDVVGRAINVNQAGALVIQTGNGEVEVLTGDVKHLLTNL